MIITADLANAVSKVNPIFLEGTLKIAAAEAKSVGLRDGQIIQAVIENRGDHTKLLLGNKEFEIPKNIQVAEGSKFQARVSILNNGSAILVPAGVSIGSGTSPSMFLPLSPHFMNLLLHSTGFGNLSSLYGSSILASLNSQGLFSDLIAKFFGMRLNGANITASDIKNFILNFGLFNEAVLAKKQKLNPNNPKVILSQLARIISDRGLDAQNITRAILDIEASQLETNQGLQNREIFFSLVFPFKDFGTFNFSFSKPLTDRDSENTPYTFNLHTKNESLGEIWLRVVVEKRVNLNMQMWATDHKTFKKAKDSVNNLSKLLADAGLSINSFEIFNEKKPGKSKPDEDKNTLTDKFFSGSTIDVKA